VKTIEINGVRFNWRDILKLRREQAKAQRQRQLALFELKEDSRPPTQKTASDRYANPLLFKD